MAGLVPAMLVERGENNKDAPRHGGQAERPLVAPTLPGAGASAIWGQSAEPAPSKPAHRPRPGGPLP